MQRTLPCRRIAIFFLAVALGSSAGAAQTTGQLIGPAGGASRAAERAVPAAPATPGDPNAPAAAGADSRAIIIVGGRPQGPAPGRYTLKSGARPKLWEQGVPAGQADAPVANRALGPSVPQPVNIGQPGAARSSSMAQPGLGNLAIQGTAANSRAAAAQIDCVNPPPRISNIQGRLTPGQPFTINGMCFGTEAGSVELTGLPGGKVTAQSTSWDTGSIRAVMPAVNGGADQQVAVTVVRRSDRKASPSKEASFVVPRQRVDVPAQAWSPAARFHKTQQTPPPHGAPQETATFSVKVHPSCALDELNVTGTKGKVMAVNGWTQGGWQSRPHEASVSIPWSYGCRLAVTPAPGIVPELNVTDCEIDFVVSATAYCPVGVNP